MTTHRVTFDLKVEDGGIEATELKLIANTAYAKREAEDMLFRAYGDRAQITGLVTYLEEKTGKPVTYNVEFSFHAAETVLAADQAYQRHRLIQLKAREIMAARNAKGLPDAVSQWTVLQNEVRQHEFPLVELPPLPRKELFVACEFEADEQNCFSKVVHFRPRLSLCNALSARIWTRDGWP